MVLIICKYSIYLYNYLYRDEIYKRILIGIHLMCASLKRDLVYRFFVNSNTFHLRTIRFQIRVNFV